MKGARITGRGTGPQGIGIPRENELGCVKFYKSLDRNWNC